MQLHIRLWSRFDVSSAFFVSSKITFDPDMIEVYFFKDAYDGGPDAHSIGTLLIDFFTFKNMFEWKNFSNLGDKIFEKKCVIKISSETISTRHFKFFCGQSCDSELDAY